MKASDSLGLPRSGLAVRSSPRNAERKTTKQMNWKKYLIGFLVFMAYYLVARNLENRVALVAKAAKV